MWPDMKEVLETYPTAADAAVIWFTKKMFSSFEDEKVPDEIKDYMEGRGVTKEQLAILIDLNPRMLFDFFDENEIFIEISLSLRKPTTFGYLINRNKYGGFIYETRKHAEAMAALKSFEILNNKLEDNEGNNEESI
jgi:hypothetical protein